MNKKGQANIFEIILAVIVVGLIVGYAFNWISFGGKDTTPVQGELPEISEEEPEAGEVLKFQKCTTSTDCNWDQTKYYNRDNCTGAWRCMISPSGESLCSFGCDGNQYCGDGVCGGEIESEWTCADCDKDVGFIGKLIIG